MSYNSDYGVTPPAATAKSKPKKPRTLNVVATHYYITYKGELKVCDVITAPARNSTMYKYRERGLTEGHWSNLRHDELVPTIAKAKAKAVKAQRKSIAYDKKALKRDQARLKKTLKIKVK